MKIIVALDAKDSDLKEHDDVKEGEDLKEEEDLETAGRYSEDDADITIISSDRIAFKVHSFLLLRASAVFKSMINMAQLGTQRDPINLTDNYVEHSLVVHATLDIIYDREILSFKDDNIYHYVIEFARKWDIPAVLRTISKELLVHTHSLNMEKHLIKHLRLALDLGESDLITTIIKSQKRKTWMAAGSGGFDLEENDDLPLPPKFPTLPIPTLNGTTRQYLEGAQAFDLDGWPYSSFATLPTPFVWAMLRAQKVVDLSPKPHLSNAFTDELGKLLDTMYPNQAGMSAGGVGSSA